MFDIPLLRPRDPRDPAKLLDDLVLLEKKDGDFLLRVINCPEDIAQKISQHAFFIQVDKNTCFFKGDADAVEVPLALLNKVLGFISVTRRLELMYELATKSGSIRCAEIDNEDLELVTHPKDHAILILRITTRSAEIAKTVCHSLYLSKFETDIHSETFQFSRNYRVTAKANLVLIQGNQTAIRAATQRLFSIHQCVSQRKHGLLLEELGNGVKTTAYRII